jgi:ABC-type polysaccharide/polyol phosphate export permease
MQTADDSTGTGLTPRLLPPRGLSEYDSSRRGQPFIDEFFEAWRYRDLILQFVSRDIRTRYKRSVLGIAWTMLNPLLMMLVLTVVFSNLFRFNLPYYPVYLLSALVLWTFISQTTTAAMEHLLWAGPLLSKIYVPKTVFALAAVGEGLVNLTLSLVPLGLIMLIVGIPFEWTVFVLPIPIILAAVFALGLGLLLSTLAVYFRDVVPMYQVLLSAWYFLTPILYPRSIVPESYSWLFSLNPAYHLIEAFRLPIYLGALGGWRTYVGAGVAATLMFVVGWWAFTRKADEIGYRV